VARDGVGWRCPVHGTISPLWRPAVADYGSFAEHVSLTGALPTFVPWPVPPGWTVDDFGCVAAGEGQGRASFVTCSGPSDPDGVVEVSLVSEEPGVGLGARVAGLVRTDPGAEIGEVPPQARVRIGGHPVPLWYLLTSDADADLDRSVFAGEAEGRWLWVVLRPAPAALLLQDEWVLQNLSDLGPALVDLPFGGGPPAW
jgi:hypothetical protein